MATCVHVCAPVYVYAVVVMVGFTDMKQEGCLAGSVGRPRDSQSWGPEFKPQIGGKNYLKKQTQK